MGDARTAMMGKENRRVKFLPMRAVPARAL